MRRLIFVLMVFGFGIGTTAPSLAQDSAEMLMQLDRDFSARSEVVGAKQAFSEYLADDAVTLLGGMEPNIGLEAVLARMSDYDPNVVLTWQPQAADLSGDLGYTWGFFVVDTAAEDGTHSQFHGKYFTIWKRQADGSWKAVVDGGNSRPVPE